MKLFPILAGAACVLLLAGAAAAAQVVPDAPDLFGAIALLLGCPDGLDAALLARDVLDEAEFAAALDPAVIEAGP